MRYLLFAAIGLAVCALAWWRQRRIERLLAQRPHDQVVDNPSEPRASTRFRAVVRTQERPKWEAWGEAIARADMAAQVPTWSPTERVFNPDCTVVVEEIASGRVVQSYDWGHHLGRAEGHAQSLNERAAAEGITKFLSSIV